MGQTQKLKSVTMGIKPTLYLFIGLFLGVDVRAKGVVPPHRITILYRLIYEVVWLLRYNGTNIAPLNENCPTHTEFFSHDPLRIRSSVRKCNKNFLPLGTQQWWGVAAGYYFSL